jgi:excisionase family DNA binding protein
LLGLFEHEKNLVVLDESGLFVSSTQATSKRVRTLKQLTYIIRHLNASILFICQSRKSLVPELRETLVSYQLEIKKVSENNRRMIVYQPLPHLDEEGNETIGFVPIDTIDYMPSSQLPYDSKFLPAFKIDIDLNELLDELADLDSVEVMEKGPSIIKRILKKLDKDEKEKLLSTGQYAKEKGVHVDTVRRWIKAGKINYVRTKGGQYRIPIGRS